MKSAPLLVAALTLGLAACAGIPSGTATAELCPLDPAGSERARFEAAVHDYLTAHPEVLTEMSQALRQKQQAAAAERAKQGIAQNRQALTDDPEDPVLGNPHGAIVVVEFFDNECPFCKRLAPVLARLIAENNDVRIVYKEFPILGPGSLIAAKAALASVKQSNYEAFHAALMADTTPEHQLAEPRILEIAKDVGLDVKRLKADMGRPEIDAKIAANLSLGRVLGINGTPAIIVGDRLLPGAASYEVLKAAIAEARTPKTAASQ
jgi:protein-disulfide isomerase